MRIAVLLVSCMLGLAAAMPKKSSAAVPLADLELVAEHAVPLTEVAAATRNQNHNSNHRGGGFAIAKGCFFTWRIPESVPHELVAVQLR